MTRTKPAKPARFMRLSEVKETVALKHSEIYKRMAEGRFPQAVRLGPKCVRWVEAEISEWMQGLAEQERT